ncbi:hypothetical protein NOS3756_26330 [Nostoc sp. NIES-3756]|jgi:hypothetical protein|nr:hypothetical protein NOS3756_26330 [Nostoc sp. NIES-3756]BAY38576.1 hypothetical protein NIES2111_29240 [Nostoc sp. NIES-2111]
MRLRETQFITGLTHESEQCVCMGGVDVQHSYTQQQQRVSLCKSPVGCQSNYMLCQAWVSHDKMTLISVSPVKIFKFI